MGKLRWAKGILAAYFGLVLSVSAAPVWDKPCVATQPDGTTLQCRAFGDEFVNFIEFNGYTIVKDDVSKTWFYAMTDATGASLIPSGLRPGIDNPVEAGLATHLRSSDAAQSSERAAGRRARSGARGSEIYNLTGSRKGVTILVNFPEETTAITTTQVNSYLNQEGYTEFGNTGSVRDYFKAMSQNRFDFTNTVIGPYTAKKSKAYYNDNKDGGAAELVNEALDWAKNTQKFDFSTCDGDSDGKIDAISFFYAGEATADKALWPHQSSVQDFSSNGKTAKYYQITNIGTKLTIYTFAHECMHMLANADDLYDTSYRSSGVGQWCLMSGAPQDEAKAQKVCAYLRARAGWMELTEAANGGAFELNGTTGNALVYRKSSTEYFVIENRQKAGWDVLLPGSGIIIYHCDNNGSNANPEGTAEKHYECAIMQADGKKDLEKNANSGDAGDVFTAAAGSFNATTTPNSNWWDGSVSNLSVTVSGATGTVMTVTVTGNGATPTNDVAVTLTSPDTWLSVGDTLSVSVTVAGSGIPSGASLYAGFLLNGTLFVAPTFGTALQPMQSPVQAGTQTVFTLPVSAELSGALHGAHIMWVAAVLDSNFNPVGTVGQLTTVFE